MRSLLSLTILAAALQVPATAAPATSTPAPRPTGGALATFGAHLHGAIDQHPGNFLYSPASIAMALAMTREGAAGETANEMDAVFGKASRAEVKTLLAKFPSSSVPAVKQGEATAPELVIANRLYAEQTLAIKKPFLDVTRTDYGAPIESVDFRNHVDDARKTINAWVAKQTHDRIKELLGKSTIDKTARLVLVNAIYAKAQWKTPFTAGATKPASFVVDGAGAKKVPMMHGDVPGTWGSYGGAQIVDLPYTAGRGPQLSMLVVVPRDQKLNAIEAAYARDGLAPFLAAASTTTRLRLAMPTFNFGSEFELGETLSGMGMKRAFTDSAEFPGITSTPDVALKISKVIHKAWVQVDENGTEAAAATAVVMVEITSVAPPPDVKVIDIDRSFLFFIHDASGNVLFGGRVSDPSAH